jgi:Phosphatidylserine/phosphatidylglycerophosphate/cardiolipin synthases and related enzymes
MIGDKSICKIVSYMKETRTFIVQEIASHTQGLLPLTKDLLNDKMKIFEVMKQGKTMPLLCIKELEGKPVFSSNMRALDRNKNEDQLFISINFTNDDSFNKSLFDSVYILLGDAIDSDMKYDLAKQLVIANRSLHFKTSLYKDIFYKCNGKYGLKMWKENLTAFTSNNIIANLWKTANDIERREILDKLGILLPEPEIKEVEMTKEVKVEMSGSSIVTLFDGIANNIIERINAAQFSVKIAVAWFTNFDLFNCVKSALDRNVEVILVTNNDLINNGGYCLNFDKLISCGLKLHLVEYPDMLHYKFCIIDDNTVISGSYNWTFYAEEINKEDVLIVDGFSDVTSEFVERFSLLLNQYIQVDKMPDSVPDRPQYDRSSFKQYISEELVLRAKRCIGDRKETLLKAKDLSPENLSVIEAMNEYGVTTDNSNRSIAEIDQSTTRSAIEERVQTRETLNVQHETISQRASELAKQRSEIDQQRETFHREVAAQLAFANSETERVEIQQQSEEREVVLNAQITQIDHSQRNVEAEISTIQNCINEINSEIEVIDKTSIIESLGGRGNLKITLKWTTTDDLDLHVFDPSEQEIYFNNKERTCQGVIGRLDVDANAGTSCTTTPVENIYWEGTAPIGKYRVQVNLYTKRSGTYEIPFTVTVYPCKGESKIFTNKIIDQNATISIVEFNYSDNGIEYLV